MSADFRVERSAVVRAAPEKVFGHVEDLRAWSAWSPWEKLDPRMKKTYAGPERGKGASYAWDGNSKVGAGRMEILESDAPRRLSIQLDFARPFAGRNRTEFDFQPEGAGTRVTWAMSGKKHPAVRVMSLFMDMDAMIGKQFEEGLAGLAAVVES